ncbi:MAG: hypothetical protein JRD89_08740 [Deltaproteobacteria bacterium]|nr:hypothetical protein [Deltaproteobacteria bacterium]
MTAQDQEDRVVLNHFPGAFKGRFLDIGAYDGVHCSNTNELLAAGWSGVMVEGGINAFRALCANHAQSDRVTLVHAVMAPKSGGRLVRWWENSEALQGKLAGAENPGMASTTVKEQFERVLQFTPERTDAWQSFLCPTLTMAELSEPFPGPYHFVSIDTEGTSLDILADTDLKALGAQLLCVEHNAESAYAAKNGEEQRQRALELCHAQGFSRVIMDNGVNLIVAA